mgnify:FL=1
MMCLLKLNLNIPIVNMDIDIVLENNRKNFKIVKNNEVLVTGSKLKWYSHETDFFFNNKTYKIKKKSFWSSRYNIFESGYLKGEIRFLGKYFFSIFGKDKPNITYTMSIKKPRGWFRAETLYTLNDSNKNYVLSVNYKWKKWKEVYKADIGESIYENYELLAYTLFLIRLKHYRDSAATGV